MKLIFSFLLTTLIGTSAFATSDSIGTFNYVYVSNIQEPPAEDYSLYLSDLASGYSTLNGYCVGKGLFWDGISSSAYPIFEFMIKPYNIASYGLLDDEIINVNELSNPHLKIEFTYDSVSNYVEQANGTVLFSPSFTVDVSAFPKTTDTEIFKSLVYAKLAILGIFSNLDRIFTDSFAAEIIVVGLPDQTKFVTKDFSKVYETTNYRYSSGSPVVQKYKEELLSEYCL